MLHGTSVKNSLGQAVPPFCGSCVVFQYFIFVPPLQGFEQAVQLASQLPIQERTLSALYWSITAACAAADAACASNSNSACAAASACASNSACASSSVCASPENEGPKPNISGPSSD